MPDFAAILLLVLPLDPAWAGFLPQPVQAFLLPHTYKRIQAEGVRLEIYDAREVMPHLPAADLPPNENEVPTPLPFAYTLSLLRERLADLADAPPLSAAERFPPRDIAQANKEQSCVYERAMKVRQSLADSHRKQHIQEAIDETNRLWHIWDDVSDATADFYMVSMRRRALRRIELSIGKRNFAAGWLPPPVPVWRFQKLN